MLRSEMPRLSMLLHDSVIVWPMWPVAMTQLYCICHKRSLKVYYMHSAFVIFIGCLKYAGNKNTNAVCAAK